MPSYLWTGNSNISSISLFKFPSPFCDFKIVICMYIKQVFKVSSFIDFNKHTCNRQQYVCDKNRYRFPDRWDNRWDPNTEVNHYPRRTDQLSFLLSKRRSQERLPDWVFHHKSRTVVLAYCVPRDATFVMKFKIGKDKLQNTKVDTLQEVQDDAVGGKYFFDQTVG